MAARPRTPVPPPAARAPGSPQVLRRHGSLRSQRRAQGAGRRTQSGGGEQLQEGGRAQGGGAGAQRARSPEGQPGRAGCRGRRAPLTRVSSQVLLQEGHPGAGGRPAARLQVRQKLQRLEGGGGRRESGLRVRADLGQTHGLPRGLPASSRCAADGSPGSGSPRPLLVGLQTAVCGDSSADCAAPQLLCLAPPEAQSGRLETKRREAQATRARTDGHRPVAGRPHPSVLASRVGAERPLIYVLELRRVQRELFFLRHPLLLLLLPRRVPVAGLAALGPPGPSGWPPSFLRVAAEAANKVPPGLF